MIKVYALILLTVLSGNLFVVIASSSNSMITFLFSSLTITKYNKTHNVNSLRKIC